MSEFRRQRPKQNNFGYVHIRDNRKASENRQVVAADTINGFRVRPGYYDINGATILPDGINFTVYSNGATKVTLLLYHRGEDRPFVSLTFPENYRIGKVHSMLVFGLQAENMEYAYRIDGPWDEDKGLLFDYNHVLLDPYAKAVAGQRVWGQTIKFEEAYRARVVKNDFDWGDVSWLKTPMSDSIIYEMHVRGFTMDESSGVKCRGSFAGIMEKVEYLKRLGVTALELMPIFEFDETRDKRVVNGRTLLDYWGYNTVSFFAPNTSYASGEEYNKEGFELKSMIKLLKENGIEVILDVVFNHTAEGNKNGPFISFKGFDNNIYYMLTPDGDYYNFSGCGNTLNCNHPMVQQMIVECLHYWVEEYKVDGFRFDLASILGRDQNGAPMDAPPLLQRLAFDPILGDVKLIAEAWDAGGLYQVGSFPSWGRWSEWNGKYRDCLRRFIKGGAECAPEIFWRIRGSNDMYGSRSAAASINFVTCHDGFTMYDLVSYNEKHNEANGENNNDGCNDNDSWNCGVEGDTQDKEILDLRFRQMKNMMNILFTSRGIPMLLSGDEFANSQFGNNNAYCQDNEISWLDWSLLDMQTNRELFEYVKRLIAFRKAHPVLLGSKFNFGHNGTGYPELSFHGIKPWEIDECAHQLTFGYMYAEDHDKYSTGRDAFIYVAVNAHWEAHDIELPIIPEGMSWHLAFSSDGTYSDPGKEKKIKDQSSLSLGPRTSAVLVAY